MKISYVCLLFIVYLFSIPTQYTLGQTINSGIKNLSEGSDLILTGRVVEKRAEWNADKSMISTIVTIAVEEYIKGTGSNSIIVIHPGGEIGEVGEYYSHIPVFNDKEEVLLFLKKQGTDQLCRVYEGESGKITLVRDEKTGERTTSQRIKLNEIKNEINSYLVK